MVIDSNRPNKYPKYDAFLFGRVEIQGKIYWAMKYRSQWSTKIYEATLSVKLNWYTKYDAYLLDRAGDTGQKTLDQEK